MRILARCEQSGIIALILSATLFGTWGCSGRELEGGPVFRGLQCRLAASRQEYSLGETVVVTVYVRNVSKEQLILPAAPDEVKTSFVYEGKLLYEDAVSFNENGPKQQVLFIIPPGAEVAYLTNEYDRKYFARTGEWDIQSTYTFRQSGDGNNTQWYGTLTSNKLKVAVVGKESEPAR